MSPPPSFINRIRAVALSLASNMSNFVFCLPIEVQDSTLICHDIVFVLCSIMLISHYLRQPNQRPLNL